MPQIDSVGPDGTRVPLHYEDVGHGRPVVLIHGWPLSGRAWEPQVAALVAAGHRVVTYDRRGFGESGRPWDGYDYDTFAADLHAVMTGLDLRRATLVGFSMGGGEVARYVGHFGASRVAQAVFAGAVPPYLLKTPDNPEGGLDEAGVAGFKAGPSTDRQAFLEGFTRAFFSVGDQMLVSEAQRAFAQAIASTASPKGTIDCIDAFSRTDFRADLAKFGDLSTLVLHSNADAIVPLEVSGARTAKLLKKARLHVIHGAPHGFNLSHAVEFNEALIDFLREAD